MLMFSRAVPFLLYGDIHCVHSIISMRITRRVCNLYALKDEGFML